MPRDVFGFYRGSILCHFKNPKDIPCKASQLLIFKLWIFDLNSCFKSAVITQKWAQKRCFLSFSNF